MVVSYNGMTLYASDHPFHVGCFLELAQGEYILAPSHCVWIVPGTLED